MIPVSSEYYQLRDIAKNLTMNLLDPVSRYMTKDPISVQPEDNLKKVEMIFKENKIHHLPVVEEGKLVGMLSKSDFLFFRRGFKTEQLDKELEDIRLKNYRVKEIMTSGLAKMEPDERLNIALELFKENVFHAIPIVKEGRLVGILTTFDIIRNLADDRSAVNIYKK